LNFIWKIEKPQQVCIKPTGRDPWAF